MDAECHSNGFLPLSAERVEGYRIVSSVPDPSWIGPTICIQRDGEWVDLPVELIIRRIAAA